MFYTGMEWQFMNPKIFNLPAIKEVLKNIDVIKAIEQGFVSYSYGKTVIPPVGELLFEDPPGDVHIKYGYIIDGEYYVVKIASGFYENVKLKIPPSSGLMLIFKQKTGELAGILLDQGYLTNIRTAAAGAVVAKYLAPAKTNCIGVYGAGVQGRLQVQFLKDLVKCKDIMVWGMDMQECLTYKKDMEALGYKVIPTLNPDEIPQNCNLIVMATPSKTPLLKVDFIGKGTHITAMGSDTPEKNELDPKILDLADLVVADSLKQCQSRGEIYMAVSRGFIKSEKVIELGNIITGKAHKRSSENQITVADLTGVAIQDIQISVAVFRGLTANK